MKFDHVKMVRVYYISLMIKSFWLIGLRKIFFEYDSDFLAMKMKYLGVVLLVEKIQNLWIVKIVIACRKMPK